MKKKNTSSLNVLQEQVKIDKKIVDSGKVVIQKKVHEENKDVEVAVSHEEVEIKKVAVNKYVTEPPPVRYEGNTTIIPVMKEIAVIEKKLLLVEEVHVIKHAMQKTEERTVPLRKEEIEVQHYTRNPNRNS
jgi:uncharacterized protein (TIGR02271 family)